MVTIRDNVFENVQHSAQYIKGPNTYYSSEVKLLRRQEKIKFFSYLVIFSVNMIQWVFTYNQKRVLNYQQRTHKIQKPIFLSLYFAGSQKGDSFSEPGRWPEIMASFCMNFISSMAVSQKQLFKILEDSGEQEHLKCPQKHKSLFWE